MRISGLPLRGTFLRITELLRVEVDALVLDRREVMAEILEQVVDDRGRHKTVQRLLSAAIRIAGEIGQRIDHRARDAR